MHRVFLCAAFWKQFRWDISSKNISSNSRRISYFIFTHIQSPYHNILIDKSTSTYIVFLHRLSMFHFCTNYSHLTVKEAYCVYDSMFIFLLSAYELVDTIYERRGHNIDDMERNKRLDQRDIFVPIANVCADKDKIDSSMLENGLPNEKRKKIPYRFVVVVVAVLANAFRRELPLVIAICRYCFLLGTEAH